MGVHIQEQNLKTINGQSLIQEGGGNLSLPIPDMSDYYTSEATDSIVDGAVNNLEIEINKKANIDDVYSSAYVEQTFGKVKTVNGVSPLSSGEVTIPVGVSDAPSDGKQYARMNANWSEVTSGEPTQLLWDETKKAFYMKGSSLVNVGNNSIAIGYLTSSTSIGDISIGNSARASLTSMAIGYSARSSGNQSIALGFQAKSLGKWSNALGRETVVKSYGCTGFGKLVSESTGAGQSSRVDGSPLFYVANNTIDASANEATMLIDNNDKTTFLGTVKSAEAILDSELPTLGQVKGLLSSGEGFPLASKTDLGVVKIGEGLELSPDGKLNTISGSYLPLLWDSVKSTFYMEGTSPMNIGSRSVNIGYNAGGDDRSVSLGYQALAREESVAIGHSAMTYAKKSVAIGYNAQSNFVGCVNIGRLSPQGYKDLSPTGIVDSNNKMVGGPLFVVANNSEILDATRPSFLITNEDNVKFYGDVEITNFKPGKGFIMSSPNGTKYRLTVSDTGEPVFTAV